MAVDKLQEAYVQMANIIWEEMCDENSSFPMTHDGYLKLYHLSGETIDADVILLDEFQDTNPILLDIVMRSTGQKVFVGDNNQAIYGFRGAVNAIESVKPDIHLHLTSSFRFGQGIADLANSIVSYYTPQEKKIVGLGKYPTEFTFDDQKEPYTSISSSNTMLFLKSKKVYEAGIPYGFVGGVDNYKFDLVIDANHLLNSRNDQIKDKMIKSFASFDELEDYIKNTTDKELASVVTFNKMHPENAIEIVNNVKANAISNLEKVKVIFTTAHKSKGLEWDNVFLSDDFTNMMLDKKGLQPKQESINLLYVAVTRAKRRLIAPPSLIEFANKVGMGNVVFEQAAE